MSVCGGGGGGGEKCGYTSIRKSNVCVCGGGGGEGGTNEVKGHTSLGERREEAWGDRENNDIHAHT